MDHDHAVGSNMKAFRTLLFSFKLVTTAGGVTHAKNKMRIYLIGMFCISKPN